MRKAKKANKKVIKNTLSPDDVNTVIASARLYEKFDRDLEVLDNLREKIDEARHAGTL